MSWHSDGELINESTWSKKWGVQKAETSCVSVFFEGKLFREYIKL